MDTNPDCSPSTADSGISTGTASLTWWEARRWRYNVGLVFAGVLAFLCYATVCYTLLPRVVDPSRIEINVFTTLFQGVGYLLMMGVANVCYFLGPLSEWLFRPKDVERYRRVCYQTGFWFSVLLPFGIPAWLAFLILFFPAYCQP